jgi:hypothetical protein
MTEVNRGYMRTRNQEDKTTFDTFIPITDSQSVIVDEGTNESLKDRLVNIDSHINNTTVHITNNERTTWNQDHDNLTTIKTEKTTLQPGLQIVNSSRSTFFNLTDGKGKLLVNLLGQLGGAYNIPDGLRGTNNTHYEFDSVNKTAGTNGYKVTVDNNLGSGATFLTMNNKIQKNKYYILVGDIKHGVGEHSILVWGSTFGQLTTQPVSDTTKFHTVWKKFAPTTDYSTGNIDLNVKGDAGSVGYFDSIRVYEISKTEYDAIDNMNEDQIKTKYPYVDSATPVTNPYVIRHGENLLPSFYEWEKNTASTVNSPYNLTIKSDIAVDAHINIPFVIGQSYTYSATHNGAIGVNAWKTSDVNDASSSSLIDGKSLIEYTNSQSVTFTVPEGTKRLTVYFSNKAAMVITTLISIKDPMLNLGTTAKPFKPREDSMLAFQTELYADHITGNDADEIFERNGVYYKVKKVASVDIVGSNIVSALVDGTAKTGFKIIYPVVAGVSYAYKSHIAGMKYNRHILSTTWDASITGDSWAIDGIMNNFGIAVKNSDSGWGDAYTPSLDEIKAYFNGWKMFVSGQAMSSTYNNTGTKAWGSLSTFIKTPATAGGAEDFNAVNLREAYDYNAVQPYRLVYSLLTPIIEPITHEGQITLIEGSNQIEIGSGIVLRERAFPKYDRGVRYNINVDGSIYADGAGSELRNRVDKIFKIYKDNKPADSVRIWNAPSSYGNQGVQVPNDVFSPSASFSATYTTLYKPLVSSFTGSISANEKTMLTTLIENTMQNSRRLSVIENKKSDKDSPSTWITPTLLNGTTSEADWSTVQYMKTSDGLLLVRGSIKLSTAVGDAGIQAFLLPKGYRPSMSYVTLCSAAVGVDAFAVAKVIVGQDGRVNLTGGPFLWIRLDSIRFLAEY